MIHNAVKFGSLEMVKYLVEHGAELTNEENLNMSTILFLACEGGNVSVVDYLLQHGAIKDLNNWKFRKSPLRIACEKGHTVVVQTLMKYNVDVRKEKEPLICGNEIINILNVELKKSLKHREKLRF